MTTVRKGCVMGVGRRRIRTGLWVAVLTLALVAGPAVSAERRAAQPAGGAGGMAAAPAEAVFQDLVKESIALLAPASGRAGTMPGLLC